MKKPDQKPVRPAVAAFFLITGCFLVVAAAFAKHRRDSLETAPAVVLTDSPQATPAGQTLQDLRDAVAKQEDLVEEKRKILAQIMHSQDLTYSSPDLPHQDNSYRAALAHTKLSEDKIRLEAQIETLLGHENDQLFPHRAGLQLPETIIRSLYPQYLEARRQLESFKISGLGDAHPNVVQQKEIVAGMRRDLDEGVLGLREILEAQLELAKEQLKRLETERDGVVSDKWPASRITSDGARQELETEEEHLEQLRDQLIAAEQQARETHDEETGP